MNHILNTSDIKHRNQRIILDAIYKSRTTSRTQLSRDLSLSKPAISDNLSVLLESGIVDEIGESHAGPSGGRRSILLQFNPMHKYIISVNLNYSNPVFAIGNLDGEILNSFDIAITSGTPIEACIELVSSGIHVLLQSLGINSKKVYCIALAAPGVYDQSGKLVSFNKCCDGPAWWSIDLRTEFSKKFHLPVLIYNDIKAATLGEWVKGSGNQAPDLIYFSAGLGIGSGIVLSGSLFHGAQFNAGEIFDYTDLSTLSNSETYEDTICIAYLKEQCSKLDCFQNVSPTLGTIVDAYRNGNEKVLQIIDEICLRLSIIAYNSMNFISVNYIVFGGEYAPFGDCFAKHLTHLFAGKNRLKPNIHTTSLGKLAGIQGMFYLAREQYFNELCLIDATQHKYFE